MQALLEVVLPVFVVLGAGYAAVRAGVFSDAGTDALMLFTQRFAIPCLLFQAIARIDVAAVFDWRLLASFYFGAAGSFLLGLAGARSPFGRSWPDSVAIGVVGLYGNSVLLGLPITERAYGAGALAGNYAIIAFHAPFCSAIGFVGMELARSGGGGLLRTGGAILKSVLTNALVLGIVLGVLVNVFSVPIPGILSQGLEMMGQAALPAALFGLGGILVRYRPEGDLRAIAFIVAVSLVVHPALTWGMAEILSLDRAGFRSAVLTAAVAPGVNAYIFANIYGTARRVAASAILSGTALCVLTTWVWLALLP